MHRFFAAIVVLLPAAALPTAAFAAEDLVTVRPAPTEAILANPGMGWQTFHHTADQDKNLPSWIPATVHYARWGWGVLEPEPGRIDYEFLDRALGESRRAGQKLAFRVMCCSTSPGRPYHPGWLKEVGGRELTCTYSGSAELTVPDLDDPVVLERHLDFLQRLGARYDGHPDLDHVDIGTVGWWGEWHMSGSSCEMPAEEHQRRIVDAYLTAFRRTPLVMLVGGGPQLTYALGQGAGWRADCLGDLGGFSKTWCHMRVGYPQMLTKAGGLQAWRQAPVAWETCWDIRKWVGEGWSLRYIFDYALALHGSYINNKSAPLPQGEEVRAEVERFLRRLGYRLVLKELTHPAAARAGATVELAMVWQNTGSAPCYRPYRLAYRLGDQSGKFHYAAGDVTIEAWMPGTVEVFGPEFLQRPPELPDGPEIPVRDRLKIPAGLPPGSYTLSVGVVGAEDVMEPVVQLGIQGRDDQGWYPLSRLGIR